MRGIHGMTVLKHHELCLGVMAECYAFVPVNTQKAIKQAVTVAREMGMDVDPGNLDLRMPLKWKAPANTKKTSR